MNTSKQRNKVMDFITPLDQENVSREKLPTNEEVDWSTEDIADLEKYLADKIPASASPLESATASILKYPSTELPPSSAPDGRLLLGTRSAPIIIPDSPGRENSGRNEISNSRDIEYTLNQEGTQRMDMMAPVDQGNVSGHKLPTFEPAVFTAEEIDELYLFLFGVGDICENDSQVIPPSSTSPLERATGYILGCSSSEDFPSSSAPIPDGRLLLGTRSAPIVILDSPGREDSTPTKIPDCQGRKNSRELEGTQCSNKEKRAREPESEVETLCSNSFTKMKKAKQLHEYQHESIKRTPNAPLPRFNVPSTSLPQRREIELSSIQIALDSTKCYPVWDDGVHQVGSHIVIPQSKDVLLEELLGGDNMQESAGNAYISSLTASSFEYSTRCSRERGQSIY